ncbi:hypothetical protein B0A50_00383 [Salinomyces thailandicus]|uniref:COPI associated protein n=1 Tax=Salinomyces thailandicus TaxID=706561 RepID=A0A4U0UDI2_9PEZI|nr:hypothetical protein B0A50_00383 [Salinomyces thailandica]
MDFSDIFRIVNLATAVLMVLGGVANFFPIGIQSIIIGCYCIIFGIATGLLEFQIPPQVARYASFMFSFVGRGVFYLFIGSVIIGSPWYQITPGVLVAVIGIAYIGLEFVPSIEPPANMRDAADAGWGTRALQQRSKQLRLASEDAGKGVQYVYDVVMGMDMGIGRKA